MNTRKKAVLIATCAISLSVVEAFGQLTMSPSSTMNAYPDAASKMTRVTAALFVEDITPGGKMGPFLPKLGAELASALNKNGFAIVRPEDHLSLSDPEKTEANGRTLLPTMVDKDKPENLENLGAATLVQIARDVGATCYLKASVTTVEQTEIVSGIFDLALTMALNAYGAARGDGVYGDTVTVHGRVTAEQLVKKDDRYLSTLIREASNRMGESFANGMRDTALKSKPASFKIICDIPATVKIDGVARGDLDGEGPYRVETGLHTIEVLDNPAWPYYQSYKTRVFIEDGARFTITLYLNDKGVAKLKEVNNYMLEHRKTIDAYLLEHQKSIDDLLYWEQEKDTDAVKRINEVAAAWISFTNSLALSTFEKDSSIQNGNKVVASALRNGEKLVDAAIEDEHKRVEGNIQDKHLAQEQVSEAIQADVKKTSMGKDVEIEKAHAEVKKAEVEGKVELEKTHAAKDAQIETARANKDAEIGKAEVRRRVDAETHEFLQPLVTGAGTELGNSWARVEDTRRLLAVKTKSEGTGITTVDYDPEVETTINLESENSRTQKK